MPTITVAIKLLQDTEGKEGTAWDIEKLEKGSSLEVFWQEDWYDCTTLDIDIDDNRVRVSWVGGKSDEDEWVDFSTTRAPEVTSFPS